MAEIEWVRTPRLGRRCAVQSHRNALKACPAFYAGGVWRLANFTIGPQDRLSVSKLLPPAREADEYVSNWPTASTLGFGGTALCVSAFAKILPQHPSSIGRGAVASPCLASSPRLTSLAQTARPTAFPTSPVGGRVARLRASNQRTISGRCRGACSSRKALAGHPRNSRGPLS